MEPEQARSLLQAERDRLASMLESVVADTEAQKESLSELSMVDQHPGDVGSETFEREKDLAIADSVEQAVEEVDAALQRLDAGTYGRCEVDGEPIPDARLEVLPAARYCVEHQTQREDRTRA
jgi:RNA polymerase-binding transcription factor DksA